MHIVCVCESVVCFNRAGMQAGRFFYVLLLIVVPARKKELVPAQEDL